MTDFDLGPTRGLRPDERDDAPVVSVSDFARVTWEDTRKVQNADAHLFNYSNAFDDISDRVRAATGEALDNPFRSASAFQSAETLGTFSREAVEGTSLYAQWRQRAQELKAKHPDKLDWDSLMDGPGRVAWESMKKAREATDAMSERIGMVAPRDVPLVGGIPVLNAVAAFGINAVAHPQYTAAQLAASFAGQMTSPADAVVNLISFGAGGAAKSIIKNATLNALSNAAGQAILSAPKQLSYRDAGLPYGWQVWADEVGGAAATGFALDAAVRTPARAAISRFGRDTPAGTAFSRNTPRGGFFLDAVEDTMPKAAPRLDIDPETIRKAQDGDIAASKEILEKTGAMEDGAVRYAVEHLENGGKLTEDMYAYLEKHLGVARPDGMRIVADATHGRYSDHLPDPIPQAPAPLLAERGAELLDRLETSTGVMEQLPASVRTAVEDGLQAGIPRLVKAVQQAIDAGEPIKAIGAMMPLLDDRTMAEVRIHGGRASPTEIARYVREYPGIIDSNVPLEAGPISTGRTIARMDDMAYAEVMQGGIPSEVAAMVAERVPGPQQAGVIADLKKAQPKSIAEAADLIEAITPPPRVPGTDGQLAPGARIEDPAGPEAKARTEALRQEAGQVYDDTMAPIQRRDEIADEIKKLRGQLIKGKPDGEAKGGEGEASGPGAIRKQIETLEREQALLQAQIVPGPKGVELAELAMAAIDRRRIEDLSAAINDALDFGAKITPKGTELRVVETLRSPDGFEVDATSDMTTGHVQLAMLASDPKASMGHEAVHTLVTLGHLSPTEVDALASLARDAGTFTKEAEYRSTYANRENLERLIVEEMAGGYIEARIKRAVDGPPNTVVERVRQLIERIKSALRRQGFQSREDVVQAIVSGEAARRQAQAEWRRDAADVPAADQMAGGGADKFYAIKDQATGQEMRRALDTLDSPSGKTGLGQGFALFELSQEVKRSVFEEGQQLYALPGDKKKITLSPEAEAAAKARFAAHLGQRPKVGESALHAPVPVTPELAGWLGIEQRKISADLDHIVRKRTAKDDIDGGAHPDLATAERARAFIDDVLASAQYAIKYEVGEQWSLMRRMPNGEVRTVGMRLDPNRQGLYEVKTAFVVRPESVLGRIERALRFGGIEALKWKKDPAAVEHVLTAVRQLAQRVRDPSINKISVELSRIQAEMRAAGKKDGDLYALRDLDLAPESRKARAEAMGFDTSRTLYHGTNADDIRSVNAEFDPAEIGSARLLASLRDSDPPIKADMAIVDRMNQMTQLIAACRG